MSVHVSSLCISSGKQIEMNLIFTITEHSCDNIWNKTVNRQVYKHFTIIILFNSFFFYLLSNSVSPKQFLNKQAK
jgi:hypothetical protein